MQSVKKCDIQSILKSELEKLKRTLKRGYELKVLWIPDYTSKLSGEVRGDHIYIYDEAEDVAVETLKHEFIDYVISKIIEPYREVTNKLISLINDAAYKRKEKLVDALCQLLR